MTRFQTLPAKGLLIAALMASAATAAAPPATAPAMNPGVSAQPVVIYDAAGNVLTGFGSAPSSAFSVAKTSGIGTTAVLVSDAAPTARRTVRNSSSVACELMPAATAYGTGHPLPAGESFTFDGAGRTTAPLYVACAAAGGSVSVVSY